MSDILDAYRMEPVAAWTSSKVTPLSSPTPSLIYGLELEIEGLGDRDEFNYRHGSMRVTDDGSLRNHGAEFVLAPMTYSHVIHVLEHFFSANNINAENYSERCSIHVHTNVQNLTFEQLANICMIYQVFERVLFRWIGHERDRNIFCVPWYDTGNMTYRVVPRLERNDNWVTGEWLKYTALNLLPVSTQGTIEWRHMEGHCDVKRIARWLRFISHIYRVATTMSNKEIKDMFVNLNTTSQYLSTINQVFQEDAEALKLPGYEADLEEGALNMKYSIMDVTKDAVKKIPRPANIEQILQRLQRERPQVILDDIDAWTSTYTTTATTTEAA